MAEKPILFNDEMIRAILDGRKTQTRRPMRQQPAGGVRFSMFTESGLEDGHGREVSSTFQPGDILWVRETFYVQGCLGLPLGERQPTHYAADIMCRDEVEDYTCKPSIHMPRWASRITLEVTDVVIQRIQEIRTSDIIAEGVIEDDRYLGSANRFRHPFATMWDALYAKRGFGWNENPWVEAVTFAVREVRG